MFIDNNKNSVGFTLIELVVFIVVISLALGAFIKVVNNAVNKSVDPALVASALNKAHSQLDAILAFKFDESTPVGGIPACGTTLGVACNGIVSDTVFDDVGDFNGFVNSTSAFTTSVSVVEAGSQLGLADSAARLVTVVVSMPNGQSITLSAFKVNF